MHETEVQPLRALILRMMNIVDLLLARQLGPSLLSLLIPDNIVELDKNEQADVVAAESKQNPVTTDVVGPVVLAVDVGGDNVATLYEPGLRLAVVSGWIWETHMLYNAALTARVRTLLLLREFQATRMAWQYG